MSKRTDSLLFKFGIIFAIFTVVVLITSGLTTYFMQVSIYKEQCERNVQNLAEYLKVLMTADGEDFVHYQEYFLENRENINIPIDFDGNYLPALEEYEELFAKYYPGMTIDVDIPFDDMEDEVKMAFEIYTHEYWLYVFEAAARTFDACYTYYITPGEEPYTMCYIIDAVREKKQVDGKEYIDLGIAVEEPLEDHRAMWEAWETGKTPSGYDPYDNEYGKTYAYYSPLVIGGRTLGVIGIELDIATVNNEILKNTFTLILGLAALLVVCVLILLWYIDRKYITKLEHLVTNVKEYTERKDPKIAEMIGNEAKSRDEISALAGQTSAMIIELDTYMKSLVKTTRELTETKQHADELRAIANRDSLTGIRNKNAYDEEIRRLEWDLAAGEENFGLAVIDLNFLKKTNDEYGHDKGNIAIKNLCVIVCNVFKHSPVFRIGGDEFAVVLRNGDYFDIDVLVKEFRGIMEDRNKDTTLEPWERTTAAIGVALFDQKNDFTVNDVFKRADAAMYKDKQEMKAVRH